MLILNRSARVFWVALSAAALAQGAKPQSKAEFFEAKVRPLLSKRCYSCHTEAKMGGLQMDTPENMMKGGEDGLVLVPGKPDQSLLVKAVRYTDSRIRMPPAGKLSEDEIAIVETWVRDGAVWGANAPQGIPSREYVITPHQRAFWSFQPVRKPLPPQVIDRSRVHSPVDAFVVAKLEAKELRQVRPADKRTLIRRATIDLIGLPPAPTEIQNFVDDKAPNAFEKVVDRLLASPHYGERWGRYWLDVARYSDHQLTAEGDGPLPNAFEYRDWVVQACRTINSSGLRSLEIKCPTPRGRILPAASGSIL